MHTTQMFINYEDNIPANPDNMHPPLPRRHTLIVPTSNLITKYDKIGNAIKYEWNYKETLSIPITINFDIVVPLDAIIFDQIGEEPTFETVGYVGQKAYNITDIRSWICIYNDATLTIWTEDEQLTYHSTDDKYITLTPNMIGKTLEVYLTDHHKEILDYSIQSIDNENNLEYVINTEIAEKLKKGVYALNIIVKNDSEYNYIEKIEVEIK